MKARFREVHQLFAPSPNGWYRRTIDRQRHEFEPPLLRYQRTFGPGTKRYILTNSTARG
jgi:hypothetical protein